MGDRECMRPAVPMGTYDVTCIIAIADRTARVQPTGIPAADHDRDVMAHGRVCGGRTLSLLLLKMFFAVVIVKNIVAVIVIVKNVFCCCCYC